MPGRTGECLPLCRVLRHQVSHRCMISSASGAVLADCGSMCTCVHRCRLQQRANRTAQGDVVLRVAQGKSEMSTSTVGRASVAVVTFNDVPTINYTFKYEVLGRIAIENRRQYCERHGYRFVSDVPIARDRPACWSKIPAILDAFETSRWVLWADSDALVFNHARSIDDLCDPEYDLVVQSHEHFFR